MFQATPQRRPPVRQSSPQTEVSVNLSRNAAGEKPPALSWKALARIVVTGKNTKIAISATTRRDRGDDEDVAAAPGPRREPVAEQHQEGEPDERRAEAHAALARPRRAEEIGEPGRAPAAMPDGEALDDEPGEAEKAGQDEPPRRRRAVGADEERQRREAERNQERQEPRPARQARAQARSRPRRTDSRKDRRRDTRAGPHSRPRQAPARRARPGSQPVIPAGAAKQRRAELQLPAPMPWIPDRPAVVRDDKRAGTRPRSHPISARP